MGAMAALQNTTKGRALCLLLCASRMTLLSALSTLASSAKPRGRLFVEGPLGAGNTVPLSEAQQHYLMNVMRVRDQESVLLFDGRSGEWVARVDHEGRKACSTTPIALTRPQPAGGLAVSLHFAPLKPKRLTQLVEKATELGVSTLQPIVTAHTAVRSVNVDKLRATCIEAAEQSGRLSVPEVLPPSDSLEDCLRAARSAPGSRVFACDERPGCNLRLVDALRASGSGSMCAATFVVGPEGGFSPSEFRLLCSHAELVSLGPNVLRAETAAMAALSIIHCSL
jgi:16S rRNA (uracil1498-N3)-methyltransferase